MPQMSVSASLASPNGLREALRGVQSFDALTRKSSEDAILDTPTPQLLPALASIVASSVEDASDRQLAAVLIRRVLQSKLKECPANTADCSTNEQLVMQVLNIISTALASDVPPAVRRATADAIGDLWLRLESKALLEASAPFTLVSQWLQHDQQHPDNALMWLLLDRLASALGKEVYMNWADQIVYKMLRTFEQKDEKECAAAEETLVTLYTKLVNSTKHESEKTPLDKRTVEAVAARYSRLCPILLQLAASKPLPPLLLPLVLLAGQGPRFFKGQHQDVIQVVSQIAAQQCQEQSSDVLLVALELGTSVFLGAPKVARRELELVQQFVVLLFETAVASVAFSTDESEWEQCLIEDDTSEETLYLEVAQMIVELVSELESEQLVEGTVHMASRLLDQDEEAPLRVGLDVVISLLLDERCCAFMENHIEVLAVACISRCTHTSARVRWAALRCLVMLLKQQEEPSLQRQRSTQLLHLLTERSSTDVSRRCRRQALLGLSTFCLGLLPDDEDEKIGEGDKALVVPFVQDILNHAVVPACSGSDVQAQAFALHVASGLAKVCGHEFTQFYPTFMTSLRQLLGSGDPERCQEEQQILKNMLHEHIGRCLIEAAVAFASDLFPAVGLETFKPDVEWLLKRLQDLLIVCETVPEASDVFGEVLGCVAVTAKSAGADLLLQLRPLLDIALKKARMKVECKTVEKNVTVSESYSIGGAELSSEGGVSQITVKDRTGIQTSVSVNVAAATEQIAALRLLESLSDALGPDVGQDLGAAWTEAALECCRAHLSIISENAFKVLPSCIKTLASSPERQGEAVTALLDIVASSLSAVNGQLSAKQSRLAYSYSLPCAAQLLDMQARMQRKGILEECCKVAQPKREELLDRLFTGMGKLLLPFLTNEFERLAAKDSEDDEWENESDSEDEQEAAWCCYDSVMQCTGGLLKIYGADCVRHFDAHLQMPYAALLAHEGVSFLGRVAALCIFADVINFGGSAAARVYSQVYLPAAILAVCPQNDGLPVEDKLSAIAAAAYGIGVVAQRDEQTFLSRAQPAVEALERCLSNPLLSTEDGRGAADCAACASLKVLCFFGSRLDVENAALQLATLLEKWFPLKEDEQEMFDAHELLLQMVIHGNALCQVPIVKHQLQRLILHDLPENPNMLSERVLHQNLLKAAASKIV